MSEAPEKSEADKDDKAFSLNRVLLALAVVVVFGLIRAFSEGAFTDEDPASDIRIVSAEELGIDVNAEPVSVDLLAKGVILVDGFEMNLEALQENFPVWKEEGRVLSYYYEKSGEGQDKAIHPAVSACLKSGMIISVRMDPQNEN